MSVLKLGDCESLLKDLEDKSIDLIVTSPPYDNLRTYGDTLSWNFEKFKRIAKELYRVLKDGGVIVWNVNDATIDGSETCTSFKQALFFKEECGLNLHDTMIWQKTNPMPQIKTDRYSQCFEYMFIFSKGSPKTFNPIMRDCKFGGLDYNSTAKNIGGENGRKDLNYTVNSKSVDYNIWQIAVAQNKTNHPAVFPLELATRHIFSWSNEGDTVLDPFVGSGTVLIACRDLNRKGIGFESNETYYNETKKRIDKLESQQSVFDFL